MTLKTMLGRVFVLEAAAPAAKRYKTAVAACLNDDEFADWRAAQEAALHAGEKLIAVRVVVVPAERGETRLA